MGIRDQDLIARAFAGDDVVAQFEEEKEELAVEQDDKIIDNTLPGWGSWAGEGVTRKGGRKHLTKIAGVKKQNRQDAKLEKVIVNEKKVKKVCCLPHPPFYIPPQPPFFPSDPFHTPLVRPYKNTRN